MQMCTGRGREMGVPWGGTSWGSGREQSRWGWGVNQRAPEHLGLSPHGNFGCLPSSTVLGASSVTGAAVSSPGPREGQVLQARLRSSHLRGLMAS